MNLAQWELLMPRINRNIRRGREKNNNKLSVVQSYFIFFRRNFLDFSFFFLFCRNSFQRSSAADFPRWIRRVKILSLTTSTAIKCYSFHGARTLKEAALEWPKRLRCACLPIQRNAVCFERADGAGLKRVSSGGSDDKVRFIRTAAGEGRGEDRKGIASHCLHR